MSKEFNVNLQIMFPDSWDIDDVNAFFLNEWEPRTGLAPELRHVYTFDMKIRRGKGVDNDN